VLVIDENTLNGLSHPLLRPLHLLAHFPHPLPRALELLVLLGQPLVEEEVFSRPDDAFSQGAYVTLLHDEVSL